ncbi:MAG: phosphotransferase [Propionicimonas sp.]
MSAFAEETELLTSPAAAGLLQAALTGDPEVVLPGFTAELDDLHYRPGSEVTAIYTVSFRGPDGQTIVEHLLATTAEVSGRVAVLSRDGITLRVWRHPADPRLPGLAPACDPATVLGWLSAAEPRLADTGALHLELLAYRPLRRAVLRATADDEHFYLKVMRPGYDDRLATRQNLLAGADLTVPLLSRPAPGVLISPSIAGRSLAHRLVQWQRGQAALPAPEELTALLDRLPTGTLSLPKRASWSQNIDFHAATARQQLPSEIARIDAVAAAVADILGQGRHGPLVPTHGDFYEANIFVDGDTLRFIDIDSVGPGLREDDLACCLAHLAVLPSLDRSAYPRIPEVLDAWQHAFERQVDAVDLRARTAGVLLSLVSGAEPDQALRRLEISEHYIGSAR